VARGAGRRMGRAPDLGLLAVKGGWAGVLGRPKKGSATLGSLVECTEAMRLLLLATLTRERLTANREEQRARVTKSFRSGTGCGHQGGARPIGAVVAVLRTHLNELETGGKSTKLTYGTMGRRLSRRR